MRGIYANIPKLASNCRVAARVPAVVRVRSLISPWHAGLAGVRHAHAPDAQRVRFSAAAACVDRARDARGDVARARDGERADDDSEDARDARALHLRAAGGRGSETCASWRSFSGARRAVAARLRDALERSAA